MWKSGNLEIMNGRWDESPGMKPLCGYLEIMEIIFMPKTYQFGRVIVV